MDKSMWQEQIIYDALWAASEATTKSKSQTQSHSDSSESQVLCHPSISDSNDGGLLSCQWQPAKSLVGLCLGKVKHHRATATQPLLLRVQTQQTVNNLHVDFHTLSSYLMNTSFYIRAFWYLYNVPFLFFYPFHQLLQTYLSQENGRRGWGWAGWGGGRSHRFDKMGNQTRAML